MKVMLSQDEYNKLLDCKRYLDLISGIDGWHEVKVAEEFVGDELDDNNKLTKLNESVYYKIHDIIVDYSVGLTFEEGYKNYKYRLD